MKKAASLILTTALAGTLAFVSLAPAAYAQQNGNRQQVAEMHDGHQMRGQNGRGGQDGMRGGRGGPGGFIHLVCSEDGAERLENAIDLVDNRVTLTDEQAGLLAELKTAALSAQTEFADNCIAPVRDGTGNPVDGMMHRQENMKATVAAMDDVIPAFDAFYSSLTDDQKADLKPQHPGQPGGQGPRGQMRGHNKG